VSRRATTHGPAVLGERDASLPIVVVLPGAVDADDEDDARLSVEPQAPRLAQQRATSS
jgi:hypothetical protein